MAAAALACSWISLPQPAFLLTALGIVIAWAWYLVQGLRPGRNGVCSLELTADGSARWQDRAGQWHEAEILPDAYVSSWLIVLRLGAEGRRRLALALLPDSAAANDLRRLRVWLRWRLSRQ